MLIHHLGALFNRALHKWVHLLCGGFVHWREDGQDFIPIFLVTLEQDFLCFRHGLVCVEEAIVLGVHVVVSPVGKAVPGCGTPRHHQEDYHPPTQHPVCAHILWSHGQVLNAESAKLFQTGRPKGAFLCIPRYLLPTCHI